MDNQQPRLQLWSKVQRLSRKGVAKSNFGEMENSLYFYLKLTMVKIYVLIDPRTNLVRYVGATSQSLKRRLTGHIGDLKLKKANTYKINWIRELQSLSLKPIIKLIEETEDWVIREKFWYDYYKSKSLTNSRDGGSGVFKKDADSIARSSQAKFKEVYQFSLNGTFIHKWDCLRDVDLHYCGKAKGAVRVCLRGKSKSAYGYLWSYTNNVTIPKNAIPKIPVTIINNDGTTTIYKSVAFAALTLGIPDFKLRKIVKMNNTLTEDIVHQLQKCS